MSACVGCGCTDEHACPGGCSWAQDMDGHPWCSVCEAQWQSLRRSIHRHFHPGSRCPGADAFGEVPLIELGLSDGPGWRATVGLSVVVWDQRQVTVAWLITLLREQYGLRHISIVQTLYDEDDPTDDGTLDWMVNAMLPSVAEREAALPQGPQG